MAGIKKELRLINRYYVYTLVDPNTKEIFYVGKGSGGRAWVTKGTRQPELDLKYRSLINLGYTPDQFVVIVKRNLGNEEALALEKELIAKYPNTLNSPFDWAQSLTPETVTKAKELRKTGLSYDKISRLIGTSTMTCYRSINGITKYTKELI